MKSVHQNALDQTAQQPPHALPQLLVSGENQPLEADDAVPTSMAARIRAAPSAGDPRAVWDGYLVRV